MEDRQQPGLSKQQVFILIPNKFVKNTVKKHLEKAKKWYGQYEITLIAHDDLENTSLSSLYNHLSDRMQSSQVPPLIIPTDDRSAVVHAALAQKFPYIRAPSLLSEFLCLHKAETFKITPKESTVPYFQMSADTVVDLNDLTLAKIGTFPVFVKPAFGTNSDMAKKVKDLNELNRFTESNRLRISTTATNMSLFLSRFLDVALVENAINKPWVIQPYVCGKVRLVCADGLVCNGKVSLWNIQEFVFWEKSGELKCLSSPVDLTSKAEEHFLEAYDLTISELISRGFNHQFASLEAFVTDDGRVSILEVNGRALRMMNRCYIQLYGEKGDTVRAMLQVAEGEVPETPVAVKGVHTCLGYVCLFDEGAAEDFINFETAELIDEIEMKVTKDEVISPPGEWGHQVAHCYTSGKSREEAMATCRDLVDKIIITKDKCKWLTH